ncbi:MAG: REP-associated tyrosine transposase [Planctomycetaceae bacterium]
MNSGQWLRVLTAPPGATAGLSSSVGVASGGWHGYCDDMSETHRKTIKHIHEAGHIHELTFSCYGRKPLLTNDVWRGLLAECITRATECHRYRLVAFVFMPEHVHLLLLPERDASDIPALLRAIKRPYSYRIKQLLTQSQSRLLDELTVRQRPGVSTFRYWQEGPGYDRNITDSKTIQSVINYIHENPVKRGLCKRAIDWKWSSARRFVLPDSPVDPDLPHLKPLPPEFEVKGT